MMHILENENIRAGFDDAGRLTELLNRKTGRDYAGGGSLWRLVYEHGVVKEELLEGEDFPLNVERVSEHSLSMSGSTGSFGIRLLIRLEGDALRFDAELENHSDSGEILREWQFPVVKNVRLTPRTEYIDSAIGGRRFRDIPAFTAECATAYMCPDHEALESGVLYPGIASLNFLLLAEEENTLYLGSHDAEFNNTLHLLRRRREEYDCAMVKYPFLRTGERCRYQGYVLAPVAGNWRQACDLYKAWLVTWRKPIRQKLASILDSNGWQRVIMRHQYGKRFFAYDELPDIREIGMAVGIDTLLMFAWTRDGHDSCYPDAEFDTESGGREELAAQIADFQQHGGHVIPYFNGQLIDVESHWYRHCGGEKYTVKLASGREHMEFYPFGGPGTGLRQFGNKVFVTACPACEEWLEVLKRNADIAIDLGCNGVFFDQLGYLSRPCCDPSHGHRVPFMNVFAVKADMVRKLAEYIHTRAPGMAFGIEWINDITSQYADFVHNIVGGTRPEQFLELVRYVLPDVITTDRDIRDDTDIPRRVNHALRIGVRSDVEIFRCRALINSAPVYRDYLIRANAFRDRHREFILNGEFLADGGFACSGSDRVAFSVFRAASGELGVVLTGNDCSACFHGPADRKYLGCDVLGDASATPDATGAFRLHFGPESLILLTFGPES